MNDKKGFTLVEILAIVVILSLLAIAAGAGITGVLQRQRQKLAYTAEQNVHDASVSYYSKNAAYMKACKDSSGANIVISQKNVEALNKYLRETKFKDFSGESLYQLYKNYSINGNDDPANKYELDSYIKVSNRSCYKLITVGELIEQGLISDSDGMCNKSSMIIVYRKADAKNTAGITESVQEAGICKSDRKSESGPVVTITPPSDLSLSNSKKIKVMVTTESTKLKTSFTMNYGWSTDKMIKPSSYSELKFNGNTEKSGSAEISLDALNGTRYLWIKGGVALDNKNNKTSEMIAGPYDFLPTVNITFDFNTGDASGCPSKKTVVFSKTYGLNINGVPQQLCKPSKTGYDFKGWYKDGSVLIEDGTKVTQKTDHKLVAKWQPHVYTITLDKNAATNTPTASLNVTYDTNKISPETITLPTRVYNVKGFGLDASRHSAGATVSSNAALMSAYTFHGWTTTKNGSTYLLNNAAKPVLQPNVKIGSDDCTIDNSIWKKTSDVTAYAKWTSTSVTLPNITKNGFTCGWTTSSDGTTIEYNKESSFTPTKNTDMYGVCIAITYNITYNYASGSLPSGKTNKNTYTAEDNDFTLNNPVREGYTFDGWTGTGLSTKTKTVKITKGSTGDRSYTANWSLDSYTITYALGCGTATNNTSYTYETPTFALNNPSCSCRTFTGWSGTDLNGSANKNVSVYKGSKGNRSYTAHYSADNYTITYNYNNGKLAAGDTNKDSYNVDTANFTLKNPSRNYYNFVGWTGTGLSSATSSVTVNKGSCGNRSYTANWTPTPYAITYHGLEGTTNNANNPSSYTVESNDITIASPANKSGYTFSGWATTSGGSGTINLKIPKGSHGNKDFYATWTKNSPTTGTIKYDNCGSRPATMPDSYELGKSITISGTPTINGYVYRNMTYGATTGTSITIPATATGTQTITCNWCYACVKPSNGNCTVNLSTCACSSSCDTGYRNTGTACSPTCTLNKVSLRFETGGGEMKANHGSEYTLSGEVIKKNGNEILLTINHGASKKLPSANWSGGINLKKTGYVIDSTSQWKLKGTSKTYTKNDSHPSSDFCSIDTSNCEKTLVPNWKVKQITVTFNCGSGATRTGVASKVMKYTDSDAKRKISTTCERTDGKIFSGWKDAGGNSYAKNYVFPPEYIDGHNDTTLALTAQYDPPPCNNSNVTGCPIYHACRNGSTDIYDDINQMRYYSYGAIGYIEHLRPYNHNNTAYFYVLNEDSPLDVPGFSTNKAYIVRLLPDTPPIYNSYSPGGGLYYINDIFDSPYNGSNRFNKFPLATSNFYIFTHCVVKGNGNEECPATECPG